MLSKHLGWERQLLVCGQSYPLEMLLGGQPGRICHTTGKEPECIQCRRNQACWQGVWGKKSDIFKIFFCKSEAPRDCPLPHLEFGMCMYGIEGKCHARSLDGRDWGLARALQRTSANPRTWPWSSGNPTSSSCLEGHMCRRHSFCPHHEKCLSTTSL